MLRTSVDSTWELEKMFNALPLERVLAQWGREGGGSRSGGGQGKVVEHAVWFYAHEISSEGRVRCFKEPNAFQKIYNSVVYGRFV
jgi:hypothetical protein